MIDGAVGLQHLFARHLTDGCGAGSASGVELADQAIRIDHRAAGVSQQPRHRRLAARHAAGEADSEVGHSRFALRL